MGTKTWEELEITDDFLFGKVMRNPELCKRTIEVILGIEIDRIDYLEEQKTIDMSLDAKSIRLDVYVKDGANTVYNIEMQPVKRDNLPKRSRYYQGMIDLALIEKGEHYSKLNRSYVIFICSFDLFGKNRCVYTFENRCIEDSEISLGDETVKVFLNSRGDSTHLNSNLKAFLEYMNHKKESENDFITMLDREVKKAKANLEWRREYMTLYIKFQEMMEEGREEGLAEGRVEGLAEGREEGLAEGRAEGDMRRLISQVRKKSEKGISSEVAADMLEESPEMIERIMNLIQNYPTMDDKQIYDELNS
ncbi:Rpn family recombination-promoting nuclease/putative transposase [Frisingicoccus caecimuris]|uniref:Putative transposase/invertase (TIGR01784 family) n=1 Tax=Frisingicoccus caecimuris TaxID=1796636 RepID=A0A4R2LHU7_9FIRM|nr:Rpn family recombination-promoting nuclease/putative transposase [Frisingicoccus caecimuris]MCR1917563.1 Rpn family recombination-promoting nuclease/putative transposase [Frisingicoccus caecimuris]TCO85833.1 putative transposase/invertase (TIGR01784 family) [Frisingicoccus caecimuris]